MDKAFICMPLANSDIYFMIDVEDFEKIYSEKWYLNFNGRKDFKYIIGSSTQSKLHRILVNVPNHMVVDHINHNIYDCRKHNLRICTHAQNMQNRILPNKNNQLNELCIYPSKNKYKVEIRRNHKRVRKSFKDLDSAIKFRDAVFKNDNFRS